VTENIRWYKKGSNYFLKQPQTSFKIKPLKFIYRKDGMVGIVFNPSKDYFSKGYGPVNPKMVDRAVIINLPENYNKNLKSLTIYFYDSTSFSDIERVVKSIKLNQKK